jgi:hypothetical protein
MQIAVIFLDFLHLPCYTVKKAKERKIMSLIPQYPDAATIDVGQEHTMQYACKTNGDVFDAYRHTLASEGFSLSFFREACGTTFATYASSTHYVHLYYTVDTHTARVISAPTDKVSLPPFTPETGVDFHYPSRITQAVLDYYYYDENDTSSRKDGNFGACYVVSLDNGSVLVYDGGGRYGKNDVERIWGLIRERGRRNAEGKIVVAAWIITHEHQDHFWCMHHVFMRHGEELQLNAIYCTPIARHLLEGHSDPGDLYIESPDALAKIRAKVGDFRLVRMHTGQAFWVRNVKVEVMNSPEDIFPEHANRYCDFNDTSVVTRLTVNGKTFLNLGDAYHVSSRVMIELWGNELKSDYCTLAHHGWGGCTRSLYDHVRPALVFVPFSRRWVERIFTEETYYSKSRDRHVRYIQWAIDRYGDFHKITQHVFFDLLSADPSRFLLADGCNKTLNLTTGEVTRETTHNEQIGYPY